jgi:hypothetical protein
MIARVLIDLCPEWGVLVLFVLVAIFYYLHVHREFGSVWLRFAQQWVSLRGIKLMRRMAMLISAVFHSVVLLSPITLAVVEACQKLPVNEYVFL